jgi:excisionase family DNA binding protein
MTPPGTIDAIVARLLDEALERRLQPLLAELAELRAAQRVTSISEETDPYLTPEEVARIIKYEVQTVNRWIRTGRLAAIGPPRGRRVRRSVVARFMAEAGTVADGKPDLDRLADAAMRRRRR